MRKKAGGRGGGGGMRQEEEEGGVKKKKGRLWQLAMRVVGREGMRDAMVGWLVRRAVTVVPFVYFLHLGRFAPPHEIARMM